MSIKARSLILGCRWNLLKIKYTSRQEREKKIAIADNMSAII